MDIGATKTEGPRQFLQETPTQSAGGSAPTSGNTCSNLPLDDARSVALETTPNPLSYWPPPTSGLPLINSSKDKIDGPQNQISSLNHSHRSDSSNADQSSVESSAVSKCSEVSHSFEEDHSPSQPTKILHHNLPPIAGITSSHNYRGVREVQKHAAESKPVTRPDKNGTENVSVEGCDKKDGNKNQESVNGKSEPEKPGLENGGDCEIVEVPQADRPKTSNSDHVFSIPAAINSHPKTISSTRAPTPFVHASGSSPVSANPSITETLTLNVNSCTTLSAGSPSPSSRTAPSPHFIAPSPGNVQCPSPSENSRVLASPSGLQRASASSSSSSSSHLKMSSPVDGSRMLPSSLPGVISSNSSSPSPRMGSLPYAPNSHPNFGYLNALRNQFSDSSVQNYHGDRSRSGNEVIENDKMFKEVSRHSQISQNFRMSLPKTTLQSINSTSPQRIDQPVDQICRNPFELPLSKPFSTSQYQQQQHHHHQQQQQQIRHFPNNVRHSSDSTTKMEHYMNLQPNNKEQQKSYESTFHAPAFKPVSPRVSSEKEFCDVQMINLQSTAPSKGSMEQPQNDASAQRRNELYSKPTDLIGSKPNTNNVGGSSAWSKQETGDNGNKATYYNAQNVNKNFMKVNGNEYNNRRVPETGYQNSVKQGAQYHEVFGGRFNGEKQSAGFNAVNEINCVSQRFPPVPQSNYDLNRQIYDTMTGGSRAVQPQVAKPLEKSVPQFSKEQNMTNPQMFKNQPYYTDFADQDKSKNYIQNISIKQNDYSGQARNSGRTGQDFRLNSYGQFNNLVEKSHDPKRTVAGQASVNPGFQSQLQPIDSRHAQSRQMTEVSKPHNQGFQPPISSSHHNSPSTRPIHSTSGQSIFMPKHQQNLTEYDSKKLLEVKAKNTSASQFPSTQNVHSVMVQPKNRVPPLTNPVRSKRESPLDLSVKTVRQSADSTAKDDGEVYMQSFRNFMHNSNQAPRTENRYPVSQSNDGATGAPKIDFTPNFSGFHADTQLPVNQSLHHKSEVSVLPPVESFKKFPTRPPQDPKIRSGFTSPKYFSPSATTIQKPQSSTVDPISGRYPHMDHFKTEAQKRPANEPIITHPSQPKIPKIDPWKLAFDQQIEQRLNSARLSQQNSQNAALNGMDVPKTSTSQYPSNYQTSRHSANHYRSANMYPRPPVQTSATPYNPSYVQQPQCQPATPQTPQEKMQNRDSVGHSPDPEQIIKQISRGVMPDHKLLQDKNVLSILRSSLEEKEAKLMQLREAARKKEKYKELMTSDLNKKQFQTLEQSSKSQTHSKQSLPPFGALTLERMCAPPSFPGHRLNLPRPVDTVKIDIEPTQKYFSSAVKNEAEKSGIPNVDMSPQDDAQGPPTDLDGLAAFLAARIRTKGELKQVGPTLEPGRPGAGQPLRTHSGSVAPHNEYVDRGIASNSHTTNLTSSGSPPKLVRESRLLPPLRRRLFSYTEEETPTTSGTQNEEQSRIPPRDPNGIRSSSETSVFDFRESDSEGEMPVLERQTLEGMRRDRKTFGSKQNVSTTTPDEVMEVDKPEVIAELDKSHPDPFWDTAFDMFVEELEKRPPKRSVRKKRVANQVSASTSETEDFAKSTMEKPKRLALAAEENRKEKVEEIEERSVVEVKKEPEENVQEGHVKLSSSRLKIYRDELLKEDKLKEVKVEKENAKCIISAEKAIKEDEKECEKQKRKKEENIETGIKTRGKSKGSLEKEPAIVNYETDSERDLPSDSESTVEDDDDSLSLSGLESESSDSDSSQESSNSNTSSYDDSDSESETVAKKRIQTRLQTRSSRQRQVKGTGMKLRSKPVPLPKAAPKSSRKKKKRKDEYYSEKKKKPSFGDGSDFRPGWEEECYKFKQQLRMPEKLISISRPPKRSSASLPDLDPYRNSPSLDSSDVSLTKKSDSGKGAVESDESDTELGKQKSKSNETSVDSDNAVVSLLKLRNGKKTQSRSIINLLVNKYGKGNLKKTKELKAINERKSPRILPKATNKPELLPTPSLGIGKENVLKDKKKGRDGSKKKLEENDSVYLGYFRRKTVNNFKEAFKQKVGLLPQEFSPVILKSRTRTQTRDLKKRATLVEVFGEDRPASAPPLSREDENSTDQEKVSEKKKPKIVKKVCGGVVTRGRGKLTRSGRPGLRSTAVLRSNKAVQISKRHLNSGRKRNIELLRIRAMASKKFSYLVASSDASSQLPITKKRLKLRSVRRKFRSGFDYIRKKKKMKKDGDSADGSVKEKRLPTRPNSESVEDIQNEIKNWVINKGLGETILHRAARLGYTDIAAYCLEKMDCSPSPRDNAGYTPLHEACSRGHLEIAKLLLMYGASVSESAKGGIRPLHEAAENGFTELIRLLLSYGADPLLETYTGHTALSLVTDEEARRLMQHHLADVQGNVAPVWTFLGPSSCFDPPETGYDPLIEPPSPHTVHSDYELEVSDSMLPPIYRLAGDSERRWVLMRDLLSYTKAKSKDAILKQLDPTSIQEMKLTEFNEQGRSCNLLGAGEKSLTKASKVVLVSYDEKVRQLLGVEKILI